MLNEWDGTGRNAHAINNGNLWQWHCHIHLSALLHFWLQLVEANPPLPPMLTHAGTDSALLAATALPPVLAEWTWHVESALSSK